MGFVGDTLDKLIPAAGDQASFEIQVKVPLPSSPAYLFLTLAGFGARGIEGAATSGYANLAANPRHLEVSASLTIGAGAKIALPMLGRLGIEGGFTAFLRGGAATSASAMQVLSYAAYRMMPEAAAIWWKGGWSGTLQQAEEWAAGVEKGVLGEDAAAYAEVGGGVGVEAEAGMLEASAGFEMFKRYSAEILKGSEASPTEFSGLFGGDVASDAAARERREKVKGAMVKSFAASFTVAPRIAGQAVGFDVSASAERSGGGDKEGFWKNFGVELAGSLGYRADEATKIEQITVGLVAAGAVVIRKLIQVVQDEKTDDLTQRAVLMKDSWDVAKAAMQKQISSNLARIGGGSSMTVAIVAGLSGGEFNWRFDIRQAASGADSLGFGSFGVSVEYEKVASLASVGVESGKPVGRFL